MKKQFKTIPHFNSEAEERRFWQTHDSTEYVDYAHAKRVRFPNLKLTSRPITLRLPETLIEKLKVRAHKLDMPYQSLIKQVLFKEFAAV